MSAGGESRFDARFVAAAHALAASRGVAVGEDDFEGAPEGSPAEAVIEDVRIVLEAADRSLIARADALILDKDQTAFLQRLRDGRDPGVADRLADKVRQQMRKAGLAHMAGTPRRWMLTPAGELALKQQRS